MIEINIDQGRFKLNVWDWLSRIIDCSNKILNWLSEINIDWLKSSLISQEIWARSRLIELDLALKIWDLDQDHRLMKWDLYKLNKKLNWFD